MTAPADVVYVDYDPRTNLTSLEITIHEAAIARSAACWNTSASRFITCAASSMPFLTLSGVKRGAYRALTREEVAELYKYK